MPRLAKPSVHITTFDPAAFDARATATSKAGPRAVIPSVSSLSISEKWYLMHTKNIHTHKHCFSGTLLWIQLVAVFLRQVLPPWAYPNYQYYRWHEMNFCHHNQWLSPWIHKWGNTEHRSHSELTFVLNEIKQTRSFGCSFCKACSCASTAACTHCKRDT